MSPLDGLLGYRLRRASMALMGDLVEILRPFGISVVEASFLILVGANPGCRQSDVGRALAIKRANLTPLVGRLKARGLVADAPIDGRSLSLTLTDAGVALRDEALALISESDRQARQHLAIDEQALFAALASLVR
ncbi:MAG: MarR family transcriptional regulator [Sphingomonadales bacterium]|nr:MarR family transcriptional regulator [Sphingomonadales bacterium]